MKGILKAKQKRRNDSLDILKPEHAPPGLLVHAYVNAGPTGSLDEVAIPQVGQQLAAMQVFDDHSQVPVGQPINPDVGGLAGQVSGVGFAAHVGVLLRTAAAALDVHRFPHGPADGLQRRQEPHRRSEERRVGKECRSRWSPYH